MAERIAAKVLVHLSMCAADRDQFGGPEWVVYDYDDVADLPADVLVDLERQMRRAGDGDTAVANIATDWNDISAVAVKARLWFARRAAGMQDEWASFNPRYLKIRVRIEPVFADGGDVDPPADGSAESSTTPADSPSPIGSAKSGRRSRPATGSRRTA